MLPAPAFNWLWRYRTPAYGLASHQPDPSFQLPSGMRAVSALLVAGSMAPILGPGAALPASQGMLMTLPMPGQSGSLDYANMLVTRASLTQQPSWQSVGSAESMLQAQNWSLASQAMQDVMQRALTIQNYGRSGTSFYGKDNLAAGALRVNAQITGDWAGLAGEAVDFLASLANVVTAGLSNRMLNGVGLSWAIDTTSSAYFYGQIAGVGLLMVLPGGGVLGTSVMAMKVAGSLFNAYDSFRAGDYVGGAMSLTFAVMGASRMLGSMRGAGGAGGATGAAGGSSAGSGQNLLGNNAQNLIGASSVVSGARTVISAVDRVGSTLFKPATTILGGVVQGAIIGGGVSGLVYAGAAWKTGNWDTSQFLAAVAGGAAGGAVAGGIMGGVNGALTAGGYGPGSTFLLTWGATAAAGGLGAGAQSIVSQFVGTGQVDWTRVQNDVTTGLKVGAVLGIFSGASAGLSRMGPMNGSGGPIAQFVGGAQGGGGLFGVAAVGVVGAPAVVIGGNVLMMAANNLRGRSA